MARTVRSATLETRAARTRLASAKEPYWCSIQRGAHVGYYKGRRGGSWLARMRTSDSRYRKATLGKADDIQDADGLTVLSFGQAQAKARGWFTEQARQEAGLASDDGPYSVGDALDSYLDWYGMHRRAVKETRVAVEAHIRPHLGDIEVSRLTAQRLRKWLDDVTKAPPRLRTKSGQQQKYRSIGDDAPALRRRKASANRVLTILKAALNHAFQDGRASSDEAWRRVRPFRNVESPRIRYLTEAESVRLVNACSTDFRPLAQAALLTGARYGEIAAMRASDYNPDAGSILIRESKAGHARHVVLTDEGIEFFEHVTAGKAADDWIFSRGGRPWGKSHQTRPLQLACEGARIAPAVSFHILRHSYASRLAMRGTPLTVIARQLGHSDTRMVEKHYAHLSPSYVADTVRANFGKLGIVEPSNVRKLEC